MSCSPYVIPEELAGASLGTRARWLINDAEADDRMRGVPRYQPRYTEREHQIIGLLALDAADRAQSPPVTLSAMTGRWTVDEYDWAWDSGLFEAGRIELLDGEIYPTRERGENGTASMGVRHIRATQRLTRSANRYFDEESVGCQTPILLSDRSEPEPDLWVARPGSPVKPRASDLLLVVEVSLASLAVDRDAKVPLYEAAGIPEVWLVDLVHNHILAYRGDPYRVTVFAEGNLTHSPTGWTVDVGWIIGE